jgi:hypothetical protein
MPVQKKRDNSCRSIDLLQKKTSKLSKYTRGIHTIALRPSYIKEKRKKKAFFSPLLMP